MVNCVSCDKEGEGNERKGRRKGRGTSSLVEEQLNVLFFIQNLLDIPRDIVNPTELIERDGDPSGWIHFCGKCLEWVEEGKEAYRNILHFENVLEKCKKNVEEAIRNTWKRLEDEDEIFFNVSAAIRHAVVRGRNNRKEEYAEEDGMDPHLPNPTVSNSTINIDQEEEDAVSTSAAVEIEPEDGLDDIDFNVDDSCGSGNHEDIDMVISICPEQDNVSEENRSHRAPPMPVVSTHSTISSASGSGALFSANEDSMELEDTFPDDATICPVCFVDFPTSRQLRNHHSLLHTDKTSGKTCPVCGKTFRFQGEMRNHYNAVHRKKIVANCVKCGKGFAYKSMLDAHQCLVDIEPQTIKAANANNSNEEDQSLSSLYKCPFCPDLLTTARFVERHVLTFHKSWDCQICGEKFSRGIDYSGHVKDHFDYESGEKYLSGEKICVFRKDDGQIKILSQVEQQGNGLTNNPDGRIIELQYGCKTSRTGADLRPHLSNEHNGDTARQKVQCDECGIQVNKGYLPVHKQSIHAPPPDRLLCPNCGKSYKDKGSLGRHYAVHHVPEAAQKKCKCPCCGKGYPTDYHLRRHQKRMNHYPSEEHQQQMHT